MVAAVLGASMIACAGPPERATPVGRSFAAYEDPGRGSWTAPRNRPLATVIWYPAAPGSREARWRVAFFNAGWSAQGAPLPVGTGKLPLIVLSHGTGGAAPTLSWLAEALASNGYIVAAVNHHGNTAAEPSYQLRGFILWWERAKDVSVLTDKILADPQFGPHVDPARIGVVGFSLGGYTALATVGARLVEHGKFRRFCADRPDHPSCSLPPESPFSITDVIKLLDEDDLVKEAIGHAHESFRDPRIRAAFAIAPALGSFMTAASLAEIRVPVRIIVGSNDDQTPAHINARPIAAAIPSATLEVIPGVAHYTFLANCNLLGRVVARSICADPAGIDREQVHRRVGADALEFFNRALRN